MRHELVDHVRVRDDGREAQLRSNVRGTRSGREDVVVVDEWVPLGLASQGLEQANQRIAEGAEALDDRRDELAAYALRKRVVLEHPQGALSRDPTYLVDERLVVMTAQDADQPGVGRGAGVVRLAGK